VLLERGSVAQSWRSERWDSLRLLTPNWMSNLPGFSYRGEVPDGFMRAHEVVAFLDRYRASFGAPIIENAIVTAVRRNAAGYLVDAGGERWQARAVVVAAGAASTPRIPRVASAIPQAVNQLSSLDYRNPDQLDEGGVLVVGASASGTQIADELAIAGFDVVLAVGEHLRVPRMYRGMDIHWWLQSLGVLDERFDTVDDIARVRSLPSLQLIGTPERRNLDINTLMDIGVEVVGRLVGVASGRAQFSGGLPNAVKSADLKQDRLLDAIDDYAFANGLDSELSAPERAAPTAVGQPATGVDISRFKTVIWATGYRPSYPWLDATVLDGKGAVIHYGGVMPSPGMYVLGLRFMRRRRSNFLDGVGQDATYLAGHLSAYLDKFAARS